MFILEVWLIVCGGALKYYSLLYLHLAQKFDIKFLRFSYAYLI